MRHISSILAIILCMVGLSSCVDEFDHGVGRIGEGCVTIPVTASFDAPDAVVLNSRSTGGTSGTAIEDIHTLWLMVYSPEGDRWCSILYMERQPVLPQSICLISKCRM